MRSDADIAAMLSAAFVAGAIDVDSLVERGSRLFGQRWRWLRPLARRVCHAFDDGPRPRPFAVARFLLSDRGFLRACEKYELTLGQVIAGPATMSPVVAAAAWNIPAICTPSELADWLGLSFGELEWLADRRGWEVKCDAGRLRHYHYRPLAKRFGSIRLIEAPKPRLKEVQRRILAGILAHIPLHDAAHGFRQGRSIRSFAAPHIGRRVVLRLDLADFFPSIRVAQIQALFRTIGYPDCVADLLAGLCSNSAPVDVLDDVLHPVSATLLRNACLLYSQPHLPQGAPTSPVLANLCAYRLDCRLAALAASAQASYTRYADDLAFSGDLAFQRAVRRFQLHVCATAMEEGFAVQHRKTRIMRQSVCQRLAGIVVNQRLNVSRADYDRLKATLTNCIRSGPQTQNRGGHADYRAHLLGKVSFIAMIHPVRGVRLRELFEQIAW